MGQKSYRGNALIAISDEIIDISKGGGHYNITRHYGRIKVGETFFIKTKRKNILYNSGGKIHTTVVNGSSTYIALPGGLKYHIKSTDNAIYIGTTKYHRDDFNGIKKVELINEYKKTRIEFLKKFGQDVPLKKIKIEATKQM